MKLEINNKKTREFSKKVEFNTLLNTQGGKEEIKKEVENISRQMKMKT